MKILSKSWYVLHVRTGEETTIRDLIRRNLPFAQALAPQRLMRERKEGKWSEKVRTLFQGYVFVYSIMTPEMYYKLTDITGVINILKGASSSPTPVPDEEMRFILRFAVDNDLVGISDLVVDGDNIKVTSGPLEGYEGQIVKVDKRRFRAKVKFELMGQEKFIELGINVLEKII